jgi:hypothetical protein
LSTYVLHRSPVRRHNEASSIDVEAAEVVGVVPAAGLVGAHLGRPAAGGPGPEDPVNAEVRDGGVRRRRGAAAPPPPPPPRRRQHRPRRGPLAPRRVPLDDAPRRRCRWVRGRGRLVVSCRRHRGEPGVLHVAGHRHRRAGRRAPRAAREAPAEDLVGVLRLHGASPGVARAAVACGARDYMCVCTHTHISTNGEDA